MAEEGKEKNITHLGKVIDRRRTQKKKMEGGLEVKTFDVDFIHTQVKPLIDAAGIELGEGIKRVKVKGEGNVIILNIVIGEKSIGVQTVLKSKGGGLRILSNNAFATGDTKIKIEKAISTKLANVSETIKSQIKKIENKEVAKMEILYGKLKVTFKESIKNPQVLAPGSKVAEIKQNEGMVLARETKIDPNASPELEVDDDDKRVWYVPPDITKGLPPHIEETVEPETTNSQIENKDIDKDAETPRVRWAPWSSDPTTLPDDTLRATPPPKPFISKEDFDEIIARTPIRRKSIDEDFDSLEEDVQINLNKTEKDIEKLPKADQEKIGWGLNTIGFKVEQKKNDFFSNTFHAIGKGFLNQEGTMARFCKELESSFTRDSEEVKKKGLSVQQGKEKARVKNFGLLAGNILKYGRMVADVTGASIANPFRYVMMGGMISARVSEAGKEARLKSDAVREKTWLDAEDAYEEAMNIYNNAPKKLAADGYLKADTETLKNTYLDQMPKKLLGKLENPKVASNFVQKIVTPIITGNLIILEDKILKIEGNNKLSDTQKSEKKQKILKKWEKTLNDYDRMITKYGTVDELASLGLAAQKISKGVVLGMQIETAVVSIEKLFENVSHMFSSDIHQSITSPINSNTVKPEVPPLKAPTFDITKAGQHIDTIGQEHNLDAQPFDLSKAGQHLDSFDGKSLGNPNLDTHSFDITKAGQHIDSIGAAPSSTINNFVNEGIKFDHGKGGIQGVLDLRAQIHHDYPDLSKAPPGVQEFMKGSATEQAAKFHFFDPSSADGKESALIREGSTLKFDQHGSLIFHDAATGKDVIKYDGRMFDSDHSAAVAHVAEVNNGTGNTKNIFEHTKFGEANHTDENIFKHETFENKTHALKADISAKIDAATPRNAGISAQSAPGRVNIVERDSGTTNSVVGNHFRLPKEILSETNRIYDNNLRTIFPGNESQTNWLRDFSHRDAHHLVSDGLRAQTTDPNSPFNQMVWYMNKLKNLTGLKPKNGIFGIGREDAAHYIARNLQWLASKNRVEEGKFDLER